MVGQAVGATGASPKDDRQDAGPTRMPVATKSCFFSRLLSRTPIILLLQYDARQTRHRARLVESSPGIPIRKKHLVPRFLPDPVCYIDPSDRIGR